MIRLTGGEFRGRLIHTPKNLNTRPSQARLRQALFNSLQAEIPGARVLDLFAGSGTLGFEALSRGAESIVFVELDSSAALLIKKNAELLKTEGRVKILKNGIDRVWKDLISLGPFTLILADPPYASEWTECLLDECPWQEILEPSGYFCIEWGLLKSRTEGLPDRTPFLVKVREKIYGESVLTTYQRA